MFTAKCNKQEAIDTVDDGASQNSAAAVVMWAVRAILVIIINPFVAKPCSQHRL